MKKDRRTAEQPAAQGEFLGDTAGDPEERYDLQLFVTGTTPRGARAIVNVRKICDTYLSGRYKLEVIDILADPQRARRDQIIAAPTLIKQAPLPVRRLVGDMSRTERLLAGLDLQPA